jgi:hypothetical protein
VTDRAGETEPLARLFRIFAATQCRGRSPSTTDTARLIGGIPGDEPVVVFGWVRDDAA